MKEKQLRNIGDPLRERCVFAANDRLFRAITFHMTMKPGFNIAHPAIDPEEEKKELLKKYTKDDLQFVLSQLDLEFEKEIGYNYDYVYDIIHE